MTTDSSHAFPISPNLPERRFGVDQPDRVWSDDIT